MPRSSGLRSGCPPSNFLGDQLGRLHRIGLRASRCVRTFAGLPSRPTVVSTAAFQLAVFGALSET